MSFLVTALGLVVLGGWAFNVPALTSIRPTLQSMKGNTALSFVCLGAALWLAQNDKRQRGRRILGLSVVVIAGATLAEYAFHVSPGIDQILFRNTHMPSLSAYPGRMAISTATCLLLLGLAVTFLGLKKAIALRQTLVAICFAFSVVALCGYLYGAKSLYSVTSFSTVGVHTAAGLFAASLAYFLARADEGIVSIAASDTNSGLLLRTLFPAIIVVNILIGWLRLEGQRANLYDTPFGVALLVLVSIGCLTLLSVLVARSMHRLESEHSRGEAARIRSAAIVGSSDDAIVGTDVSGTVTDWNKGAERLFGYTASEAIGKNISFITPTDQLDQAQRIFEKVTSREVLRHHETVRQRKDGTRVEISLTASPIVDDMGRVVGVSGIARDVTERKRAEEALRISEERLRLAQWAAHIGTFDLNLQTRADIWQPETEALYGLPPGGFGGTLTAFEDLIHPDDRERVIQLTKEMMRTGQPTEAEWRVVWPDGSVHWIASRGQVFMDESGEPSRMLGVNMDVTERKRTENALGDMTRKLIEAQEQERARIGRELHDDINQRLAMLSMEMEQLGENPSEVELRVGELRKRIGEISNDVQALSHDLHSSKLEYLGVVAGMKSWCKEFAERQKVEIEFGSDMSTVLQPEIGVSLFRVLQEALQNAVKHSGVRSFEVHVREDSGEVHLIASDSGKGFDVEAALQGKGLGLTSMRERVRLVDGTITIESKPMRGTRIHVRVPLGSRQEGQRAIG